METIHAGKPCPACGGDPTYSHVTDAEMKNLMKHAVDRVYELLSLKANHPQEYAVRINFGALYTARWDDPAGLLCETRVPYHAGDVPEGTTNVRELNRSAVIVMPKQPFLDWLRSVDPKGDEVSLADLRCEPTVYLVSECESDAALARCLRKFSQSIFEDILNGWWTEQNDWPKDRSFAVFRTWFEWDCYSMVADLCERSIVPYDR